MLRLIKNNENAVVVLHEIFGINEHIKDVCQNTMIEGLMFIAPLCLNMGSHLSMSNGSSLQKIC